MTHFTVIPLGILLALLYFISIPTMLRRDVSVRAIAGLGFLMGGLVFSVTIAWPALHDDYPGWLPAIGTVVSFDDTAGDKKHERAQISFRMVNKQTAEAWLSLRVNDLWRAVPGPPDDDGRKNLYDAILPIIYDPSNPGDIALRGTEPRRLLIGGLVFASVFWPIGIVLLTGPCRDSLRNKRLEWAGTRSEARIIDFKRDNTRASRFGRNSPVEFPWMIQAEWVHPQTGAKYLLESGSVWQDPRDMIHIGAAIDVLIDYSRPVVCYALDTLPFGVAKHARTASPAATTSSSRPPDA